MTKRCILIFPRFSNLERIQTIRCKHDPLAELIGPHITLVFPFESNFSTEETMTRLQLALRGIRSFPLVMREITGWQDEYLFLNVKQGNDQLIHMHDQLCKVFFDGHVSRRFTYQPHITIGRFTENRELQAAMVELANFDDSFETDVDEVHVEIIGTNEESVIELSVCLERV